MANHYATPEYWDQRYLTGQTDGHIIDWMVDFNNIKPFVVSLFKPTHHVLLTGIGQSGLAEEIYDSGYKNVTCLDFSHVVVSKLSSRNVKQRPGLKCFCQDAVDFNEDSLLEANSFNVVVDKGTLDCILCRDDGDVRSSTYIRTVHKLMKEHGSFMLFTHGPPSQRLPLLEQLCWMHIQVKTIHQLDVHSALKGEMRQRVADFSEADEFNTDVSFLYIMKKALPRYNQHQ